MNDDWIKLLGLALHAVEMLAIAALWLRKPGESASEAVATLSGRVDVLQERISHMPDTGEHEELKGTVKAVQASLAAIQETQASTRAAVARVEQYLLSHGR